MHRISILYLNKALFCYIFFFYTSSVNARFARRIVGQSNVTCPFQIDQSQSLEVTISNLHLFLDRIPESFITSCILKIPFYTTIFNDLNKKRNAN